MMNDLNIRELSADRDIQQHPNILFNGRTRSGKSTLMEWVFWLMARSPKHGFDEAMVFCPSASFRDALAKHIPRCVMHHGWNEGALAAELKRRRRRQDCGKTNKPMIFIADDCSYDSKLLNSSLALKELAKNGRQLGITRFVACQAVTDLKPDLRDQFDLVFIPKMNQVETAKKVHKYLGGQFPDCKTFLQVLRRVTRNYGAMVLVNTNSAEDLSDEVFWARAMPKEKAADDNGPNGPVRIGEPVYWKLNAAYYSKKPLLDANAVRTAKGQAIRMVGDNRRRVAPMGPPPTRPSIKMKVPAPQRELSAAVRI